MATMTNFVHRERKVYRNRRGVSAGTADPRPCVFCGRTTRHSSGFCGPCRTDGFMAVYAVTKRDNGWSRAGREKVAIADGWRGRRVIGGGVGIRRGPMPLVLRYVSDGGRSEWAQGQ